MKSFFSYCILCLILLTLLPLLNCALLSHNDKEKTAEELITEGIKHYDRKKYLKAIASFQRLRDWYPFSPYATQAGLKIADSYYNLKEYEEAAAAYQSFENLHPKHEAIAHVVYRFGRCYFDRIDAIDRDSSPAEKALEVFQRFQREFPDNELAPQAAEHIKICRKNLAQRELYVGKFYLKSRHYKAALNRFRNIQQEYPDIQSLKEEVEEYIARCEAAIQTETE